MKNKRLWLGILSVIGIISITVGVSIAFFNYTRTGQANTIAVGRIFFNSTQDGRINLSNVFPISSDQAETDTTNAQSVSINVIGDTDYTKGIEYLVTASDVNVTTSGKKVPVAIEVGVTSNSENNPATTLGTEETEDYYANRNNYTVSKYKVEYDGNLTNDKHILVGYIAPNTTLGTIEGIDGVITIKAYIDGSKVAISDTYNGSESDNMGTTSDWVDGRTVFTTSEWNSLQSTGISFKVKVEANEGIWVEKPTTPASCFTTTTPVAEYIRNPNMNINTCVSKFTELGVAEGLQEGETLETFCDGTGTAGGSTLQQLLDENVGDPELAELESAGIIISSGNYKIGIENYDASCGSDVIIPSTINSELASYTRNPNMNIDTCINKFTEWGSDGSLEEGETLESYCNGTGTVAGRTLQEDIDMVVNLGAIEPLTDLVNAGIITKSVSGTVQANVIRIDDSAFYNKNLTSVAIPNSVTSIENGAFANNKIKTLSVDMTDIPEFFFNTISGYGNNDTPSNKLETLVLGNSVITIGEQSFRDNNISSLQLGENVREIKLWAFNGNKISTLEIPDSVVTIGNGAFMNNQLTSVTIPNSVTTIGTSAFANNNITTMSIDMTNIPENLVSNQGTVTNLTIGEHVQTIGNNAFSNNQLTNVTIPNSVTTIGNGAFYANQLTNVIVPNSVLARPWNQSNQCNYFDGNTSVTWNNQTVVCVELGGY